MGVQDFPIYLDLDRRIAVDGPQSTNKATLSGFQGDTLRVILYGQKLNRGGLAGSPYVPASIDWTTLKCGILKVDAAPTGGAYKIQAGDGGGALKTTSLAFGADHTAVSTALNLLANVIAAGGLTLIPTGAPNIHRVLWTNPDNALTLAVTDNTLTPPSFSRVTPDTSTPGKVEIKLMQAPVAFTDAFALPMPPVVVISRVVGGTGTRNEVQRVTIPDDAAGQFAFRTMGRGLIPVATVTAQLIADTLNAPFVAANPADIRFSCAAFGTDAFDITFIGAYANAAQTLLVVDMFDQVPIDAPTAKLPLTSVAIEDALDTAGSVALLFEVVAVNGAGEESTLCQQPFTIVNDGLDAAMALDTPDWLISANEAAAAIALDETTPVIVGTLSFRGTLGIVGEVDPMNALKWTVPHGLGTLFPLPIVYSFVGRRRLKPYAEYDWEVTDNNTCVITFAVAPDPGDYQLLVASFEAQTVLNNHEHPWTQIFRLNGDLTKTYLPDLFAALEDSLPDGWPAVGGDKIVDGSITASKLDLTSLFTALNASSGFLTLLQTKISDATIIKNIALALAQSSDFETTLETELGKADVVDALAKTLVDSSAFQDAISASVLNALQGGAALPDGSVPFAYPVFTFVNPTPHSRPGTTKIVPGQGTTTQEVGRHGRQQDDENDEHPAQYRAPSRRRSYLRALAPGHPRTHRRCHHRGRRQAHRSHRQPHPHRERCCHRSPNRKPPRPDLSYRHRLRPQEWHHLSRPRLGRPRLALRDGMHHPPDSQAQFHHLPQGRPIPLPLPSRCSVTWQL
jgi:hypothetical protein